MEEGETIVETREVLDIDFEELHKINPDVVGWIDFESEISIIIKSF